MFTAEYKGINDFLVQSSKLLLEYSIRRETRGYACYELPEPFMFKLTTPTARWVTIPERKWNLVLPYAESLWMACGRNDMDYIIRYLFRMKDYSDDGVSMRGGYGPRLRYFSGSTKDYKIDKGHLNDETYIDQFRYITDSFQSDINTRRAVINIGDTIKDCFDESGFLKQTKDVPCTRLLCFQKNTITGKLDLTVFMRSNDMLWGASAVNIFNFTFMQEYFASLLGLEVGYYYHIANNFHYYEDKKNLIEQLSQISEYEDIPYTYKKTFSTLDEFDKLIQRLETEEVKMGLRSYEYNPELFDDDFFRDWYSVLCHKHSKSCNVSYINPILVAIDK